ncbi:MAG: hydroxyethylthiazole kinase, partial [Bacteroidales bacterium]|nr:hydroxyethylthiazole kinase [Candidatus Cryptobacteroides aphodequi]
MSAFANFAEDRLLIRRTSPVIHNITNYVAMNFCANSLLALGALPIMSSEPAEMEELVSSSQALVINIGCIESLQFDAMLCAARKAAALGRPWVLDPVGAGLSRFRPRAALALAELGPAVIRGNASEILALCREAGVKTAILPPEEPSCELRGAKTPILPPDGPSCELRGAKTAILPPDGPHGVDSSVQSTDAADAAAALARKEGCVVVVSGAVDIVTDGV